MNATTHTQYIVRVTRDEYIYGRYMECTYYLLQHDGRAIPEEVGGEHYATKFPSYSDAESAMKSYCEAFANHATRKDSIISLVEQVVNSDIKFATRVSTLGS